MSALRVFDYQGRNVRMVVVDGEPWFAAKDVCDVLDIAWQGNKTLQSIDERWKGVGRFPTPGGEQPLLTINEAGVYKLAFRSQKEEAERFTDWIAGEVLPDIRKHGVYATGDVLDQILSNPDFGIRLLSEYKAERERRIEVERTNTILMHVNKTYTATEIAKELGFKSAIALNRDLSRRRIQFKQNDTWVLYSDFAGRGYTEIKQEVLDSGRVIYHRRWTQLGREFLLRLYEGADSA